LQPSERGGYALSFEGWNTNAKYGAKGWVTLPTWGGRLVENINQATCREFLRAAVRHLAEAGYPTVLHVYDEVVAQVPEGTGSLEEFERLCEQHGMPWAADWPVRAPGAYRAKSYGKR